MDHQLRLVVNKDNSYLLEVVHKDEVYKVTGDVKNFKLLSEKENTSTLSVGNEIQLLSKLNIKTSDKV